MGFVSAVRCCYHVMMRLDAVMVYFAIQTCTIVKIASILRTQHIPVYNMRNAAKDTIVLRGSVLPANCTMINAQNRLSVVIL